MNYNIAHYFERKRINISDIIYLTRKTPHTVITLMNGESYSTNIPVKEIAAFLSAEEFINISKGRKRNISQQVFENGDKKWLVTYADVALNGTKRIIHDYSPEINKNLTIHCFQPSPGYCACVLIPTD